MDLRTSVCQQVISVILLVAGMLVSMVTSSSPAAGKLLPYTVYTYFNVFHLKLCVCTVYSVLIVVSLSVVWDTLRVDISLSF